MYTSFTQFTPAIHVHRRRLLSAAGTVMVRQGQRVNADDIIAEATLPTRHVLLDVVRTFGLSGVKAAESLIQRKVGETLGEHDIIAETGGLFSRVIRTPAPGKIMSIRNGQVLVQTETKTIQLAAMYSGTISEVIAEHGAVIETSGALIQCAWGNSRFANGPLLCKAESKESSLTIADFEITSRGSVLASSICTDTNMFDVAAALPVAGLILGSIPFSLMEKALAQPYPILLTEGFGKSGMNDTALKILSLYNNHEVTLNAGQENEPSRSQQPEAMIFAPVDERSLTIQSRVTAGQSVRIHTAPYMGQTGTIEKLLPGLTVLPNGLRVCAASIIMDNKERKTIPIFDLDVIGFTQSS